MPAPGRDLTAAPGCRTPVSVNVVRLLVVLALLWTVTPTAPEVTETAVHLLSHGDAPHTPAADHDGDHEDAGGTDEHGCTPLFHLCGCHAPALTATSGRVAMAAALDDVTSLELPPLAASQSRASDPPPIRPPIG
jgi:hypothetical protein